MGYNLRYSDYGTPAGPPDPSEWVGPPGPPGPVGPIGPQGVPGDVGDVLADGSTTARNLTDRFAEVKNVLDYGAVGDGVTDCGPVLRSLIATGGAIYFPAGRYLFNGSYCVIPPNTRIFGEGPGQSVIVSGTMTGGAQDPTFRYFCVSRNYNTYGAAGSSITTPALQTDVNITIEDIGFDLTNSTGTGNGMSAIVRFRWASHVRIRNIRADNYAANAAHGWGGFIFLGCDNVVVESYYARNAIQAIDCWYGCTRVKLNNLWIEQCSGGGNGGAINWNGVGTAGVYGDADDLQIVNSTFWINDGIGLFLDSFGTGSLSRNLLFDNLRIVAKSGAANNYGIMFRGKVNRLVARGISFEADPGFDQKPFQITGAADATATAIGPDLVTTTSGSAVLTVAYTCASGVGNYLRIHNGAGGAVVGNGVSLNGYYPITAVSGTPPPGMAGTSYTITGPSAASSSGTIAASTAVSGWYGAPANVILRDITIDGCKARGDALIVALGQGHIIDGIVVTTNYNGFSTPQYNAVVSLDTTEAHDAVSPVACYVGGIVAAPGTGALPGGFAGNNIARWNSAGAAPGGQTASLLVNAANDAAAATAKVPLGAMYRNGNVVQVRVA